MADPDRKRPWKVLQSTYAVADQWLRLRSDVVLSPDGRTLPPCPVIEHPDWVDVIALTADLNIVLVDQYRHSVGSVRTEFPAGTVDDGEEPLAAIQRELLEETGYASDEWHLLGTAPVYPALQTNRISSFLALNARPIGGQALDEGEVIHAYELPFTQFIDQVESGAIELPALQLAGLWWLRRCLVGRGAIGISMPLE
ncbi:MAG: NUDIX domain-containing protein [Rhodospirillales bacterium]|nr:NUDIX domain-containing protein [Rhodospirillales bacterium]